jgi:hypothetical protein
VNTDAEIAVELAADDYDEMNRWVVSISAFVNYQNPGSSVLDDMYDQIRSASKFNLSRCWANINSCNDTH